MKKQVIMLALALSSLGVIAAEQPATPTAAPASVAEKPVLTQGVEAGRFTHDFEAAAKEAKESKKPLFVVFTGSDWCGWCKLMDKSVFAQPEWIQYAKENLVLAYIDAPQNQALVPEQYREQNKQLAKTFTVRGFPTYVILFDNIEIGRLGAERNCPPAKFIKKIEKILVLTPQGLEKYCNNIPEAERAQIKEKIQKATNSLFEAQKRNIECTKAAEVAKKGLDDSEKSLEETLNSALMIKIGPEKAAQYQKIRSELEETKTKLNEWIGTNPPKTPENSKYFNDMQKKINDLFTQMESF